MGQIIVRTCDYDDCDAREEIAANHELRVVEIHEESGIVVDLPAQVVGNILWCRYEPEAFPHGRYLCRTHERQVRIAQEIRLRA